MFVIHQFGELKNLTDELQLDQGEKNMDNIVQEYRIFLAKRFYNK